MLEAGGFALSRFFESAYGMPLVHTEADYSIPSRLGDVIRLDLEVDKVGTRSFQYKVSIYGDNNKLRATVRMTHALIDMKTRKACTIPDELLEVLKRSGALS